MKGFVLGILFTIIAAAALGYAALRTGMVPASARSGPIWGEQWVAGTSLRATLAREAPKGPNPVKLDDANLISGIQLYGTHCAVCHGTAKGKASASAIAKGEWPPPPQLAADGVEDDPEGDTFWKIDNGIRWTGMPAWHGTLSATQMWTLALFLKHMDKLPPGPQQVWQGLEQKFPK
jgi:thiosulfate dehydrogenase